MKKKIAILGPESSGKTTLAKALAKYMGSKMLPEYAREYFISHDYSQCNLDDLIKIAQQQYNLCHQKEEKDFIICDTEILTIEIWAEDKFQHIPKEVEILRNKQEFDLYILTKPDIPWEYDILRTDANRRDYLFELYLKSLKRYSYPYIVVSGDMDSRIKESMAAISSFDQ